MLDRVVHVLRLRWRSLTRRRDVEAQLADEIAYHLAEEADRREARGDAPAAAAQAARRDFGGVERAKEACRDARGTVLVESIAKDLRYGARSLLRQPAYAVPAVLTIALGIGATTAVFALVDGILVTRLPYPAPDRLVSANAVYPGGGLAAARRTLSTMDVAAYADGHVFTLTGDGPAVRVTGARVSAELFGVLGVTPARGRVFRAGEDQAAARRRRAPERRVVAHAFRRPTPASSAGRSSSTAGRGEVVGVLPASVDLPSRRTQIWVPLALDPRDTVPLLGRRLHAARGAAPAGRHRREGAGRAAAVPARRARSSSPGRCPTTGTAISSSCRCRPRSSAASRSRLGILSAAALVILVIACANVANLSLSRAATREREIGIRTAIGGTPRRVARQLLTEHLLLAGVGAVAGFLLAWPLLTVLTRVLPPDTPRLGAVALDWRALFFSALLAVVTGAAFGLAPVAHTLRLQLRTVLDAGGRSGGSAATGRIRRLLAAGQIAGAALLVIAAGPPRPQPVDAVARRPGLPHRRSRHGPPHHRRRALRRAGALPGVLSHARRSAAGACPASAAPRSSTCCRSPAASPSDRSRSRATRRRRGSRRRCSGSPS